MADFQERMKRTLERVGQQRVAPGSSAFDKILQQFVDTLNAQEPFVHASIEKGPHPQMRSFVTSPRYRRDERSFMLTFWYDGRTLQARDGEKTVVFTTPEELGDYLLDFLEKSSFPATLAEYEQRCKEDLDGFLRTSGFNEMSADDLMVLVRADDQRRLAEARPGDTLQMNVEEEKLPTTGEYDPNRAYHLYSGGFGMKVIAHHRAPEGQIVLVGEAAGEVLGEAGRA